VELPVILLQAAEDRGRFLGPVAQDLLNDREDVLVSPLFLGSAGPLLRDLLAEIGPFPVQFLKPLQGFRQGASAVDQFAHHALPDLHAAKRRLPQLFQFLVTVNGGEVRRGTSQAKAEDAHGQKAQGHRDYRRSEL
jgi:hypothetical protein